MLKVEDLGEELLSSVVLDGGTVLVGGERGVLRIWKDGLSSKESGRVVVERGETLDVLGRAPAGTGNEKGGETVVVGMGDGRVKVVSVARRKVLGEVRHDELEGVLGLGFEIDGRMISAGGPTVKVWQERIGRKPDEEGAAETTTTNGDGGPGKYSNPSDEDEDEDEDGDESEEAVEESSDDESRLRKRRKKRKRNKGGKAGNRNHKVLSSSFNGID